MGDGGQTLIHPVHPEIMFTRFNETLNLSKDGGKRFGNILTMPGNGFLDMVLAQDPGDTSAIYVGKSDMFYKINTEGKANKQLLKYSFKTNGHFGSFSEVACFAVAESNPKCIYLAAKNGSNPNPPAEKLFLTIDGGQNWTDISTKAKGLDALKWFSIKSIAVDPANENRIWIGLDGFASIPGSTGVGSSRVFYSGDGGKNWQDQSSGLTSVPIQKLVYRKGSKDNLFAATDAGVFMLSSEESGSPVWTCFNKGLPATIVTDLEIDYRSKLIYAATFGRGIWVSKLP
jgi:hypothetical protein